MCQCLLNYSGLLSHPHARHATSERREEKDKALTCTHCTWEKFGLREGGTCLSGGTTVLARLRHATDALPHAVHLPATGGPEHAPTCYCLTITILLTCLPVSYLTCVPASATTVPPASASTCVHAVVRAYYLLKHTACYAAKLMPRTTAIYLFHTHYTTVSAFYSTCLRCLPALPRTYCHYIPCFYLETASSPFAAFWYFIHADSCNIMTYWYRCSMTHISFTFRWLLPLHLCQTLCHSRLHSSLPPTVCNIAGSGLGRHQHYLPLTTGCCSSSILIYHTTCCSVAFSTAQVRCLLLYLPSLYGVLLPLPFLIYTTTAILLVPFRLPVQTSRSSCRASPTYLTAFSWPHSCLIHIS